MKEYPDDMTDISSLKPRTVVRDAYNDGVHIVVLKGGSSLCAYLGIPQNHPLAGRDYDDVPLSVHGGLTYAGTLDGMFEGEYFYGWDYAHVGDYLWLDGLSDGFGKDDYKWTIGEVFAEAMMAVWDLKKLMKLVEKEDK